ncbi:MAG: cation diffusion facilitator family transporter [Polyangiaceae bacterium]
MARRSNEPPSSNKSVVVSIISDAAIAVVKIAAAVFSGSSAMTSEAIHSSVDAFNSVFLLVGEHRSKRAPDPEHPFGYGREIYFWTLLVAVSMFAGGGALSFYEGVRHLIVPKPVEASTWNYTVLAVAAVFEAWATVSAYREHRAVERERKVGLWAAFRASKDLTTFTVLFENGAALLGVGIAFVGIALSHRLGRSYPDAVASLLIGVVLVVVAWVLIRESKGLLIGEGVDPRADAEMRAITAAHPDVESVVKLLTLQTGAREVLVVMEAHFRAELSTAQIVAAVGGIERSLRARFPDVKRIFVEASSISGAAPVGLARP